MALWYANSPCEAPKIRVPGPLQWLTPATMCDSGPLMVCLNGCALRVVFRAGCKQKMGEHGGPQGVLPQARAGEPRKMLAPKHQMLGQAAVMAVAALGAVPQAWPRLRPPNR